jgi:hypothetical protein
MLCVWFANPQRSEALADGTLRVKFKHWRLHAGYRLHVCFAVKVAVGEKEGVQRGGRR